MNRVCLYYTYEPARDRWLLGDRYARALLRRVVRGAPRPGGVDKVFINLCLGLDKLGVEYEVNLPFEELIPSDRVGVLGRGRYCLNGYNRDIPIVAGIGLMTHPSEWPTLCEEYPVVKYLQHSDWANDVYKPYFGDRCDVWPVGIDTTSWQPSPEKKNTDILIYNKIMWEYPQRELDFLEPIRKSLHKRGLSFQELRYGSYNPEDYKKVLNQCRAMIFLCEHESQGIAYQECLSADVPIFAWNPGKCLDPNRFKWKDPEIRASSVPFWDRRCGLMFKDIHEFETQIDIFMDKLRESQFFPREYILENLTLEKCAKRYLDILEEAQLVTV